MNSKLIIVGTGLFAEVARDYFEEYTALQVVAFACHERFITKPKINGVDVVPIETIVEHYSTAEHKVFVAVGYGKMNKMREAVYKEIKSLGYTFCNFIHPDVKIWKSTTLGENIFIFEDNTIQPYTSIGDNTIFWSGNHLGHHSSIGKHCFISSHVVISGSCHLGNNIFVGVNATFHDSLNIGNEVLIGAGAIVSRDLTDKQVVVPKATPLFKKNSEEIGF
ncbi:MAG: acetyltransferase [Pseudomonadota bacterium]|jgi:sugar O-acyltransferase (sialic acid O-acetyltransferase NeuD family)|uniref:Acetyltransferase n=1 Tax=Alteromonas oceani TaxID=2071609 RepID=A0ABV7JQH6_9ALTE|nr:acetyltransferase [Alteromonas oceani]MEC9261995.1 acetyltransferase [Pseudomonadota bacterium]